MTNEERAARIRAADRGKVITRFICPPIPLRQFDWYAAFDNDEPDDNGNMRVGYGKTQSEAIDDLLECVEPN